MIGSIIAEQMIINTASAKHIAAMSIDWECVAWHNTVVIDHSSIDNDRCDLLQSAVKIDVDEQIYRRALLQTAASYVVDE